MDAASLEDFLSRTAQRRVRFPLEAAQKAAADAAWGGQFEALEAARQREVAMAAAATTASRTTELLTATRGETASSPMASSPIWSCEHFLSPEECEALIELGKRGGCASRPALWQPGSCYPHRASTKSMLEDQTMLEGIRRRAALVFGIPLDSNSPTSCQISFTAPEPACPPDSASIGLHIDQNNSNDDRWATVLVYLNSLPPNCGGCTVWPCARKDDTSAFSSPSSHGKSVDDGLVHDVDASGLSPCVILSRHDASRHLLKVGVTCTSDALHIATNEVDGSLQVALVPGSVAAAKLEEAATTANPGIIKTSPAMGRAVCFFSVVPTSSNDGVVPDARSWHGGLSVAGPSPVGKWTLQLFARFQEKCTGADRAQMVTAARIHPRKVVCAKR